MNNRQLINYLPPVLQTVSELKAINEAQQPEVERAWLALSLVMDNQFIATATEEGVAVWEKELDITPYDTDTIETRKQRIKAIWFTKIAFTMRWLVEWLKSMNGDAVEGSFKDYTLTVTLLNSYDCIRVLKDMRRDIPSNIFINPTLLLTANYVPVYIGSSPIRTLRVATTVKIKTDTGYSYPVHRKCGTYPAQLF